MSQFLCKRGLCLTGAVGLHRRIVPMANWRCGSSSRACTTGFGKLRSRRQYRQPFNNATMASPTKSSGSHVNTTSHPQTPCLACGTLLSRTRSAAEESKQLILGQMGHKARIRFPKLVGDMESFTHGLMGSYIQH